MASSNKMSITTAPSTDQTCHLFRIPAELRNYIYEVCFTENYKEVNLRRVKPPSKTLLLTCHKIYNEARLMQRRAYREYWSKTRFFIRGPNLEFPTIPAYHQGRDAADQVVMSLNEEAKKNLAHISYLRVTSAFDHYPRADGRRPRPVLRADDKLLRHAWIFADGMWTCWIPDHSVSRPSLHKKHMQVWFSSRAALQDRHDWNLWKKVLDGRFRNGPLELVRGRPVDGHYVELVHEDSARVRQAREILGPQVLSVETLAIALAK